MLDLSDCSGYSEIASYHLSENVHLETFPDTNDLSNVEINIEMSDLQSIKEDVNMFPQIDAVCEIREDSTFYNNPLNNAFLMSQSILSDNSQ